MAKLSTQRLLCVRALVRAYVCMCVYASVYCVCVHAHHVCTSLPIPEVPGPFTCWMESSSQPTKGEDSWEGEGSVARGQ